MRREDIMTILEQSSEPIKGSQLAEMVGVSRQVVVQDIAIMRAGGAQIMATPSGYILDNKAQEKPRQLFACFHLSYSAMEDELETIVLCGGHILNVIVEHPVYGEIQGNLAISTLQEVAAFMAKVQENDAIPLSTLTNGIHLHTVEAKNWEILEYIKHKLWEKGYLVNDEKSMN